MQLLFLRSWLLQWTSEWEQYCSFGRDSSSVGSEHGGNYEGRTTFEVLKAGRYGYDSSGNKETRQFA